MENNRSKENLPKYIEVYNKVLRNIEEGLYNEEQKLPNEADLSKQMGVSRMTLRQSLLLLQEDGVIRSRKGVGNFLNFKENNVIGIEQVGSVLEKCGIRDVERITSKSRLDASTLYTQQIFSRDYPVLLASNIYFYQEDKCVARLFSTIPADNSIVSGVDLTNEKQIQKLILQDIYDQAKIANFQIKQTEDKENFIETDLETKNHIYTLVIEKILNKDGEVICFNKYHIPMEYVDIKVNSISK